MNRDPEAWARLGRALRSARDRQGLTQGELGDLAGVSGRSVQEAESGKVPRARKPYTLSRIAQALGWPVDSVEAVLDGEQPPGEWRDVPVKPDEKTAEAIIGQAMVRATDNVTSAEIRAATQIAVEELRRAGLIPEDNSARHVTN